MPNIKELPNKLAVKPVVKQIVSTQCINHRGKNKLVEGGDIS